MDDAATPSPSAPSPSTSRRTRRQAVSRLAAPTGGILTARQLSEAGVSRHALLAEVAAGRIEDVGRSTYLVRDGTSDHDDVQLRERFRAVHAVCPRATLDGSSLLLHAGLRGVDGDGQLHVSAPKSSKPVKLAGVRVHETRRWRPEDVVGGAGLRRVRTPVAVVRAALWARTDREAALWLVAPVQQRLVRVDDVAEHLELVRRHARRRLLRAVVSDVRGGAESLGELDFARLCRERGLPEPTRQARRQRADGAWYLDVAWDDWGVVVEIDGIHHLDVGPWIEDAYRQNEIGLRHERVLRIPVVGLRVSPDRFVDQVERALRQAGCPVRLPPRSRA